MLEALRSTVVTLAYYLCAFHADGAYMIGIVHNTEKGEDGVGCAPF